ncbi:hypothetical protein C8J56DRAFT_506314 [Mycena floridula]|nr:hypothetical protein C8J56DRAFT_506314 [Mycena floridula]
MDQNIGKTLVSGIQDISAFLPIIGTEQCERHIGSALDGGFLYAAATPLSMFGSLGIIKASIAVLCASAHSKLAQMLSDAGFKLEGSAAAMIGKVPRGDKDQAAQQAKTYVAARHFLELLKKQHIENDVSRLSLVYTYRRWNVSLILSTILLSALGIIPYIPIIVEPHKSVTNWLYPFLRIIGSATCVIAVQFIIQIRTKTILNDVLEKLKEENGRKNRQKSSENDEPSTTSKDIGSDNKKVHDPEKGPAPSTEDPPRKAPSPKITFTHLNLTFLQICLFLGIGATGVGYLGCFTVIQNTPSTKNT